MYRWVCLIFLFLSPGIILGQDPGFSQFYANPCISILLSLEPPNCPEW
jgi:hypothetical protein